jgi:hypothetical protein
LSFPRKAGIQFDQPVLDARLCGHDEMQEDSWLRYRRSLVPCSRFFSDALPLLTRQANADACKRAPAERRGELQTLASVCVVEVVKRVPPSGP